MRHVSIGIGVHAVIHGVDMFNQGRCFCGHDKMPGRLAVNLFHGQNFKRCFRRLDRSPVHRVVKLLAGPKRQVF